MKPSEEESKGNDSEVPKETPPQPTPDSEIVANLALIDRAVATLEPRFTHRVLRSLTSLKKKLTIKVLKDAIEQAFPAGMPSSSPFCKLRDAL